MPTQVLLPPLGEQTLAKKSRLAVHYAMCPQVMDVLTEGSLNIYFWGLQFPILACFEHPCWGRERLYPHQLSTARMSGRTVPGPFMQERECPVILLVGAKSCWKRSPGYHISVTSLAGRYLYRSRAVNLLEGVQFLKAQWSTPTMRGENWAIWPCSMEW